MFNDYSFKEKLQKINSADDPDKLIYEWVKTGYLSFAEFKKVLESPAPFDMGVEDV